LLSFVDKKEVFVAHPQSGDMNKENADPHAPAAQVLRGAQIAFFNRKRRTMNLLDELDE